jgi:predicted GH43/DUF377 family glycosyl hydrolase
MKSPAKRAAATAITLLFASTLNAQNTPKPSTVPSTDSAAAPLPSWAIGPFNRQPDPQPVIKPNPDATFLNPINQETVHWEKAQVYNPAAVVRDGKIVVLYRAQQGPGNTVSRIGYAESTDGFHFTCDPAPIYYSAIDNRQSYEWMGSEYRGGCEDPRLAEAPDGSYRMTFSEYGVKGLRVGIASSTDLKHWTKLGCAFDGTKYEPAHVKSAAVVHEVKDGKLVAAKINGTYWMYFGETAIHLAASDDLTHWKPLETADGKMLTIMTPRPGFFDSRLSEVGCQSVLTKDGIVVFYNGSNLGAPKADPKGASMGDPTIPRNQYCGGQALFDRKDPAHLIARLDKPFIQPTYPWEKTGLFRSGTTFVEGLALFHNQWFLYFGCADSCVGVATAPMNPDQFGKAPATSDK